MKRRLTLLGLYRQDKNRDHVRTEFEDHGRFRVVGQARTDQIELVAHVVRQFVNIVTVFELHLDKRHILRRSGGDMLQVADRIQHAFQRTRDVILDIRRAGAGISRHHHDRVRLNVGVQIDRQSRQGE